MFKQEEPDTAGMTSGHRIKLLRTVDTDVVVFAVSLTQEMYEVVNELRTTVNCSCNHNKTRHAFLDLASAPLMTLSQPSTDLWYSWYDHTCSYSEINLAKMPDPSKENFKPWNSNWIGLHCWGQCVAPHGIIPTPCHWWCLENDGQHLWTTPEPTKS